eukprot:1147544-Pelagomonas_calceolata.AAC.1
MAACSRGIGAPELANFFIAAKCAVQALAGVCVWGGILSKGLTSSPVPRAPEREHRGLQPNLANKCLVRTRWHGNKR